MSYRPRKQRVPNKLVTVHGPPENLRGALQEAIDILRDQHAASTVVFFGDDVTDEKAFRRLTDGDIGVKVGPGDTGAGYRVDSPDDVAVALQYLLDARSGMRFA